MSGIQNMLLAAGYVVTVSGHGVTENDAGGANASFTFNSDGTVDQTTGNGGTTQIDSDTDWIRPTSQAPGAFEVRATLNSGSLTAGTTGSWLALTSNRTWQVNASSGNRQQANLTIEVRLGSTILDSATYTLDANAT